MSAFTLTDTSIYAGALDASCFGSSVELSEELDVVEVTTFCSNGWRQYVPGLKTWTATHSGPQDLAASTIDTTYTPDEYYALTVGSTYPVMFVPSGAAEGSVAYGANGILKMYTPLSGSVGDVAEHSVEWSSDGVASNPLVRGVLATKATVTATGNGTGHLLGAVSATQRLYAGLHILTAGGTTPSVTAIVQSDDNSGFTSATTVITFTAATDRGAQWSSVAGAITDTYFRFRFTVSGTNPSFQIRGFLGIL